MRRGFRKRKSHNGMSSFVEKLAQILENDEYNEIISWTSDGEAFSIKNVTRLTEAVLPVFFKHRNFSSFIRQLNMYNFNKVRCTEGQHVYMNQHFRRNFKNEYRNIKRRSVEDREDLDYYNSTKTEQLASQLAEMTKKQKELELIIKHLVADNHNLRSENSKLWKRVEKNLEKSDKKVEKLMLFMLFGNQMMLDEEEEPRDTSPVACLENEIRLKIESDPEHKTPKERLVKNLLSMLRNQRESKVMEDLLESYNCNQKRRRSKKTDSMRQAEIKAESEDELDEKLPTNTPEPPIEPQEKTPSLIDDVNLFLNVEVPPSDNQFSLI